MTSFSPLGATHFSHPSTTPSLLSLFRPHSPPKKAQRSSLPSAIDWSIPSPSYHSSSPSRSSSFFSVPSSRSFSLCSSPPPRSSSLYSTPAYGEDRGPKMTMENVERRMQEWDEEKVENKREKLGEQDRRMAKGFRGMGL